jgi:hypothetical protein
MVKIIPDVPDDSIQEVLTPWKPPPHSLHNVSKLIRSGHHTSFAGVRLAAFHRLVVTRDWIVKIARGAAPARGANHVGERGLRAAQIVLPPALPALIMHDSLRRGRFALWAIDYGLVSRRIANGVTEAMLALSTLPFVSGRTARRAWQNPIDQQHHGGGGENGNNE